MTGRHGGFKADSPDPALVELASRWDARGWPRNPYGAVHSDHARWLRLHSLPESKRYPKDDDERAEVLRRHRAVLKDLLSYEPTSTLWCIADSWGPESYGSGWVRELLPEALAWRISRVEGDIATYLWIATGLASDRIHELLLAVADERAFVTLAPTDLAWLYRPYDGGADILARSESERDALRERYREWRPVGGGDW